MIIITLAFFSCIKKDEIEGELIMNPKTAELYIGQSIRFGANKKNLKWDSKNKFIGTINKDGLFTANHIGKTKIVASNENAKAEAEVHVIPQITGIPEPVTKFGEKREKIKESEKRKLILESLVALEYETQSENVETLYYLFGKDDKCIYAIVRFKDIDEKRLEDLLTFYNERYEYLGKNKDDYYFTDQRKKTLIALASKEKITARYTSYDKKKKAQKLSEINDQFDLDLR